MAQNTYKNKHSASPKPAPPKKSWFKSLFSNPKKNKSNFKSRVFSFLKSVLIFFFSTTILMVVVYKFLPVPFTFTMIDRKITALTKGEDSEINYEWKSYKNISKEAALAVVAAEDQFFPQHNGFDFKAMNKAFQGNLKGKRLKGASTITQQVAKNVFLWQNRDYIRKGLEVYFTVLIELIWGKERILEMYLNVAETGKMTFGFEQGAQKYFGHSAETLSRTEAAKMAAVLPNPVRFSVSNPSNYTQRRSNFIARQMRALGGKTYLKDL
jgi:monofunctional glycosyltransferase